MAVRKRGNRYVAEKNVWWSCVALGSGRSQISFCSQCGLPEDRCAYDWHSRRRVVEVVPAADLDRALDALETIRNGPDSDQAATAWGDCEDCMWAARLAGATLAALGWFAEWDLSIAHITPTRGVVEDCATRGSQRVSLSRTSPERDPRWRPKEEE